MTPSPETFFPTLVLRETPLLVLWLLLRPEHGLVSSSYARTGLSLDNLESSLIWTMRLLEDGRKWLDGLTDRGLAQALEPAPLPCQGKRLPVSEP